MKQDEAKIKARLCQQETPFVVFVLNLYSCYPCGLCVRLRNVAGLFRKHDDLPQWLHLIQDLFVLMTVDST